MPSVQVPPELELELDLELELEATYHETSDGYHDASIEELINMSNATMLLGLITMWMEEAECPYRVIITEIEDADPDIGITYSLQYPLILHAETILKTFEAHEAELENSSPRFKNIRELFYNFFLLKTCKHGFGAAAA